MLIIDDDQISMRAVRETELEKCLFQLNYFIEFQFRFTITRQKYRLSLAQDSLFPFKDRHQPPCSVANQDNADVRLIPLVPYFCIAG